jgi:hypothetical protein
MFQDYDDAVKTLKEIKIYSEDLAELSSFLLKSLTDEEFSRLNADKDDLLHRKLIDEISAAKDGVMKQVNKLKRMV